MTDPADRPNRIPWPPILFLGALLAANILGPALPLPVRAPPALQLAGAAIAAAAIGLMLWAFIAFRQHETTVLPHRRSDALITAAPFSLSRNPIYLSEAVLLAGLGLVNGSAWYWLAIPAFMFAVTKLAIEREEAHLAARFGADWQAYSGRVRRWL